MYKVSPIDSSGKVDDLKEIVSITGFSRIPVFEGAKNNVIGLVNIYDILFDENKKSKSGVIRDFIREAVHVKEDDGLDIALTRLRNKRQPMGIVRNSEERVVGIITIEDILEEIVGNIEDKG